MLVRKLFYYTVAIIILSWTLLFLWWDSEWTCKGQGRNQVCEFTNFCVDRYHGPFIVTHDEPPNINLINTGKGEDIWFKPTTHRTNAKYIDETLFVYESIPFFSFPI